MWRHALSKAEGLDPCYVVEGCAGAPPSCANTKPIGNLYECKGYRLPTEAEWEYAARAGTTTSFWTGQIAPLSAITACDPPEPLLAEIAWNCSNAAGSTHPVQRKSANPFGLFDMLGNASEFVDDGFDYYSPGSAVDPLKWPTADDNVIFRGGNASGFTTLYRAGSRIYGPMTSSGSQTGLRLARTIFPNATQKELVDMSVP